MLLQLDKDFRIASDEHNFILQKRGDEGGGVAQKGKGMWRNVGYWKDLKNLLLSYSRQKLRSSRADSVKALCRDLESLRAQINQTTNDLHTFWGDNGGSDETE